MEMVVQRIISGRVYMSLQDLADEHGMSKQTVRSRVKEIQEEIGTGKRYDAPAVIQDGNILLVNHLVFLDWLQVRKQFRNKNTKKYVEDFNPVVWVKYLGWNEIPAAEVIS